MSGSPITWDDATSLTTLSITAASTLYVLYVQTIVYYRYGVEGRDSATSWWMQHSREAEIPAARAISHRRSRRSQRQ